MQPDTYTVKVVGNCRIHADVYQPSDGGVHPGVVWLHGGALIFGSRSRLHPAQRALYLQAGYSVVAMDYRLAPETRLPEIIEDLRDAFRWLRDEGPERLRVDPRRLAVVGHSAGGYLALMAGFTVQPRPQAVVAFYGYGDIVGAWYSRPDPFYCQWPLVSPTEAQAVIGSQPISGAVDQQNEDRFRFYLYCRQRGLWLQKVVGCDPEAGLAAFEPFRPVSHVTSDYPPTLLLHGDHDTDVPYEQSVLMAARLADAGVDHELVTIPNGGHGFDQDMGSPEVVGAFQRVLEFLQRCVGA